MTKASPFIYRIGNVSVIKMIGEFKMKQCMDVTKVQARLKRIEGQVRGISDMAGKDVPCEEILVQINAAKAALHKVGQVILEGHLQHCVREGIEHGDAEKTIADFAKAVEHFSRMG